MIESINKALCSHEYKLISVNTTDSLTREKCVECGKIRQRDANKIYLEQPEPKKNTAV